MHILFSLITPTIRDHLSLLSHLAFALRDDGLREALHSEAPRDRIMAEFERIEGAMASVSAGADSEDAV